MRIERAILSVSDKTGIVELAKALGARGVEILSTGGTAMHLSDAGVPVTPISSWSGRSLASSPGVSCVARKKAMKLRQARGLA